MTQVTLYQQKTKKMLVLLIMLVCSAVLPISSQAQELDLSPKFGTCMDNSGGVTKDMVDCISTEYQHQDARLNAAYKALISQLDTARKKQLTSAQRAWIKFRDTNCDFYLDPDGGSLARVNANHCMMTMTAQRASELESLSQ